MNLLEVVYFMSRTDFTNDEFNRLNHIIEKSGREDLFRTSPKPKKDEIFDFLEKNCDKFGKEDEKCEE